METKQVIVVRKDLNMRKGKIVAQSCHASLAVVLDMMRDGSIVATRDGRIASSSDAVNAWLNDRFTKICVYVKSEEELLRVYREAKDTGLPCSLIKDAGLTEFGGVPTLTCCAIGPAESKDIDVVTIKLPLL